MLLGLAIEYCELINNSQVPGIVSVFERVAHSEAQKIFDQIYE